MGSMGWSMEGVQEVVHGLWVSAFISPFISTMNFLGNREDAVQNQSYLWLTNNI